jgi:phage-related baseplate assembly protein
LIRIRDCWDIYFGGLWGDANQLRYQVDDVISDDCISEMVAAGLGLDLELVSYLIRMERLNPTTCVDDPRLGNGNNRLANNHVNDVLRKKLSGVQEIIESSLPRDAHYAAYVLASMYPVGGVVALSPDEITRALALAAIRPGALTWDAVTSLVHSDVDIALSYSMLTEVFS